eukprot:TRINITY_DN4538_c0_g1_i1.p1 TRINITY_DN4538_c0_g1~~TRINITY_DN4538_c0_g1_i1.p1  ORF type:complete len:455 (+),score=155.49 TRINITY_DN4538_c0_g1_i1:121-1485(+)
MADTETANDNAQPLNHSDSSGLPPPILHHSIKMSTDIPQPTDLPVETSETNSEINLPAPILDENSLPSELPPPSDGFGLPPPETISLDESVDIPPPEPQIDPLSLALDSITSTAPKLTTPSKAGVSRRPPRKAPTSHSRAIKERKAMADTPTVAPTAYGAEAPPEDAATAETNGEGSPKKEVAFLDPVSPLLRNALDGKNVAAGRKSVAVMQGPMGIVSQQALGVQLKKAAAPPRSKEEPTPSTVPAFERVQLRKVEPTSGPPTPTGAKSLSPTDFGPKANYRKSVHASNFQGISNLPPPISDNSSPPTFQSSPSKNGPPARAPSPPLANSESQQEAMSNIPPPIIMETNDMPPPPEPIVTNGTSESPKATENGKDKKDKKSKEDKKDKKEAKANGVDKDAEKKQKEAEKKRLKEEKEAKKKQEKEEKAAKKLEEKERKKREKEEKAASKKEKK